jgi:cephalosporin hydroxylase
MELAGILNNLKITHIPENDFSEGHREFLEVDKYYSSNLALKLIKIIGSHPYPLDELLLMSAAFRYHMPEIVIDVGTHVGKSARVWHELSKEYNSGTSVHTVDIFDEKHSEFPGYALGKYIKNTPVKQHIGDGFTVASEIINNNPDAKFLIFLDEDHSYETVLRELELAIHVKQGCIVVHDTFYQPGSSYNHGPYLAIQDFIKNYEFKQVIHLQTGLPGMSYLGLL